MELQGVPKKSTIKFPPLLLFLLRHVFLLYSEHQSGVKKIKIVNCNFHNQIIDHVTVLISEQFLKS